MNHHDAVRAMENPLVLSHSECFDGHTSAWAAYQYFGTNAEYVPISYGRDPAPDVTGRDVLILDFSFSRPELIAMNERARSLVLLDHHRSAEQALSGLDFVLFDMNRSGAGITWDVIHGDNTRPELIDYVEDRDLWRFELPQSQAINAWIGCVEQTFEEWDKLRDELEGEGRLIVQRGKAVQRKIDCYVRDMVQQARRMTFAGHPDIPVVNAPYVNTSELVGALAGTAPFAVGWFQNVTGKYQYSLRSRGDFDVSDLAVQYGGGGHAQAAGFSVDHMVTS